MYSIPLLGNSQPEIISYRKFKYRIKINRFSLYLGYNKFKFFTKKIPLKYKFGFKGYLNFLNYFYLSSSIFFTISTSLSGASILSSGETCLLKISINSSPVIVSFSIK